VEDVALVVDECAVMLIPGAVTRHPEVASVEKTLAPYRDTYHIQSPATLDGGDILRLDRKIFIGLSSRSTGDAIEQVRTILAPYEYQVLGVRVSGCLHLKSAVTQVSTDTLLINPVWVSEGDFPGMQFIEVDPAEPYAANAVLVGDRVIYPSSFPRTRAKLEAAGIRMVIVDADELAKAEGAVTCCSLIFNA
jgi:dimethylargininase